ncbi:MAG: glycosyl hydrolase family 79 C-terminal domain-containing protein [Solirubrobacteraceae bacterium]
MASGWRSWRLTIGLAIVLVSAGAVVAVVVLSSGPGDAGTTARTARPDAPVSVEHTASPAALRRAARGAVAVTDHPAGREIAPGFLGLSFEFQAVRAYTGPDADAVNPVLLALIRTLTPGQRPVIRIGGDSTDISYPVARGVRPLPYVGYPLTSSWMKTTAALAHDLDAEMIMGLNLAADDPGLAAAEGREYLRAFGPRFVTELEIGNEPNVYGNITKYKTAAGGEHKARPEGYGYPAYRHEFRAVAAAAPRLPLAGPALAAGPDPGKGSWIETMSDFLRRDKSVALMTVHRYPLRNCYVPPSSVQYPTVGHLLSDYSTSGLAASLRPWIKIAHSQHRQLRLDELNSVACRGKRGISDTFASSLWVTDALFSLARAGVDGVNMHTLPNSAYELFQFSRSDGRWRAQVKPVYYGLQLFAQAAPPGARLLKLGGRRPPSGLSVWATRGPDRRVRMVLINKSPSHGDTVTLHVAGAAGAATVERMTAPNVHARARVTLGGRSYGRETYTGRLSAPQTTTLAPRLGVYKVTVPRGSAALVTFGA